MNTLEISTQKILKIANTLSEYSESVERAEGVEDVEGIEDVENVDDVEPVERT